MKPQGDKKSESRASTFALGLIEDSLGVSRHDRVFWGKRLWRGAKIAFWMLIAAIIIPVTMISLGLLLGPHGYEGLIAAPLAVFMSWALILFIGLRRRVTPRRIARSSIAELPEKTTQYIEQSRRQLPSSARKELDGILNHLEELEPALVATQQEAAAHAQLRRLLSDDLTGLIDHYQRLPVRLRGRKLHGGPTPEENLASGLMTIRQEVDRIHEEMARDDLYSLATKERYLKTKYSADG